MWLFFAITAYALLALANLGDKLLLNKLIPDPKVYAFGIGILSAVIVIIASPFLPWPILSPAPLSLAILCGASFILGALIMYQGLRQFAASRLISAIGALTPIFTFIFTNFILQTLAVTYYQVLALGLLVFGTLLITWEKKEKISYRSLWYASLSALFFSLAFVLGKYSYQFGFWPGFFWSRIGGGLTVLVMYLVSSELRAHLMSYKNPTAGSNPVRLIGYFINQVFGGAGILFQNLAIWLVPIAELSFVNALQGLQYVFVLAIGYLLGLNFSAFQSEKLSKKAMFLKIVATSFIILGLFLLGRTIQ